jgi:hypothetical protein
MPYIGTTPQFGVRKKHTYTATAGQTSFSGAGSEGVTLSYKDSNYVDVYQNGVKLGDADYTSTSGTAIVLAQGASVDDLVEIIVFDVFSISDTVSKADGGTFDGNVTMGGTLGVTGATTLSSTLGVTGASTLTGALSAKGGAVFNEDSADVDFRVESDNDANAFFVEGSSGSIGIGTSSPVASSGGKFVTIETTADEHTNLVFNTANTGKNGILEGRRTGRSGAERFAQINLQNDGDNGEIRFYTAASGSDVTEQMRISSNSRVTFYQGTSGVTQRYATDGYGNHHVFRFAMSMTGSTAYTISLSGFTNGTYKYDMFGSHWSAGYHAYRNSYIASQSSGVHTEYNLHNASSSAHGAFSVAYSGTSGRVNFSKSAGTYIGSGVTILQIIGPSNLNIHSIT